VAGKSPDAIRAAKRLLAVAAEDGQRAILLAETTEQVKLIGSPNQVAAVRANLEKRAPQFVG
jgi:enoyl-CoA hydratase/carnithine racemase